MRKNVFLFTVLGLFVCTCNSSYAEDAKDKVGLEKWLDDGLKVQYTCPNFDKNNPLYAGDACVEGCNDDPKKVSAMFAVEVKEGGAKFCVRGVEAYRQGLFHSPNIKYWESNNDLNECVWLCYNGYTGPQCENQITALNDNNKTCDPTELTPRKGPASTASVGAGAENPGKTMDRLVSEGQKCRQRDKRFGHYTAGNKHSQHDVFLAITKYDEGKHGAWVQDILVYSWCKNNSKMCRTVISKNTKDPILMCKDGYQQSTDGKTCVPIDSYVCGNIAMCDGWARSDDNSNLERVVVEVDGKSCYQYRCKGLNKGFENIPSVSEQTKCIDCVAGEGQDAHVVEDGRCVFTSKGVDPDLDPVGKPACNGWGDEKYTKDNTKAAYEPYVIDNNGAMCLQYRCAKGYAYKKDEPTTCESCTGDNQMPDQDGFCITVSGTPADCSGWSDIDKKSYTKIYDEANNCYTYQCKEKGYAFKSTTDKNCTPCKGTVQPNGTCKKEFEESNKSDMATARAQDGTLCWMKCQDTQCFKSCLKGQL